MSFAPAPGSRKLRSLPVWRKKMALGVKDEAFHQKPLWHPSHAGVGPNISMTGRPSDWGTSRRFPSVPGADHHPSEKSQLCEECAGPKGGHMASHLCDNYRRNRGLLEDGPALQSARTTPWSASVPPSVRHAISGGSGARFDKLHAITLADVMEMGELCLSSQGV
jgi:hypothetical protein